MKHAKILIVLFLFFNTYSWAQQDLNGTWSYLKESLENNHDSERFHEQDFSWGKGKLYWLNGDISIDLNENIIAFDRNWIIRNIERLGDGKYKITYSGDSESEWKKTIYIMQTDYNHLYFYNDDFEKESRDGIQTRLGEQYLWYRISSPPAIPLEYAELNDTRVRVRTEPNLSCDTWGYVNKNDLVIIKDKSSDKFEIDGEKWYWYKVESEYLPDGWVYGKYLNKISKEDYEKKIDLKNKPPVTEQKLSKLEIIRNVSDVSSILKSEAKRKRDDKKNVVYSELKKMYRNYGTSYDGNKDILEITDNRYSYNHNLKIGMSKNEIVVLLGEPDEEQNNKIIYRDKFGRLWLYTLTLYIKKDSLEKIELKRENLQ
ncbi:MAG: SH3 domain-containing protein [Treponema sp.]|nr:SH3 domain-containing protein [Treponema sp.]